MTARGSSATAVLREGPARSAALPPGLFGANFLLGRDSLTGTFHETVRSLGATQLRYPGGGIAEDLIDLRDPLRVPVSAAGTAETLAAFLRYCGRNGIEPVIVLPTKRYAADIEAGAAEVAAFVARVTSGEFGSVRVAAFEIGNEYYASSALHPALDAATYGAIASRLAVAVREAAAHPVAVSVQIGKTAADNAAILRAFDTAAERAAVTLLTAHDYPWRAESVAARAAERAALVRDWEAAGIRAGLFLSEWNIGSNGNAADDARHDYGMRQLPALVEILARAAETGVERAAIWGVQQGTKTALASNEGRSSVFAAGHLFRLMAESLPGTRFLAAEGVGTGGPVLHAFGSAEGLVLFVAAGDFDEAAGPLRLRIALDGFGARFSQGWSERIVALGDPEAPRTAARIELGTHALGTDAEGRQTVTLTFASDHEMLRLVLAREGPAQGQKAAGAFAPTPWDDSFAGTARAETVAGGAGHDRLAGGGGDDRLFGGRGFDTLAGGPGDDRLFGGEGTDRLSGGAGGDLLRGGAQSDLLLGGEGDDRLHGEGGSDFLHGEAGDDVMTGGEGADYFVFGKDHGADVITDFRPGLDVIDLSGIPALSGWADLAPRLARAGAGTLIDTGEGTIRLAGLRPAELGPDDFFFA